MKTSVSLSVFEAKPGMPVLFSGGNEHNIAEISALGYDGVDLFVKDPHDEQTRSTLRLLKKHNLGIGVIMPAALAGEGLFLGDESADVREECVRRINDIVCLASEAGAMVSLGLVRGSKKNDETEEEFYSRYVNSCELLLENSEKRCVPLVIEPINRYEINTINSARQALDFIKKYRLPLYLMLDTFHMNIEDVSIDALLAEAMPLTRHIHFLDSNRLAPSMGNLNMQNYYRLLKALGYGGYLCLEALPKPTPAICARRGADFFKTMEKEGAYYDRL